MPIHHLHHTHAHTQNLAGQGPGGGAGGRVELVLDGTRRFEGRYEDPLGTTLVVDGQGRGAGAGVAGM